MSDPTRPVPPTRKRPAPGAIQEKSVARKPGHVSSSPGENAEEHVPELEHQQQRLQIQQDQQIKTANQKINDAKKVRSREDSESKKRRPQQQQQSQSQGEGTKAGVLALNSAYHKYQNSPNVAEIVAGKSAPKTGESLGAMLPQSRMTPHPDLPEAEMRPPVFLTPLEAMKDIYMRVRGRMSNKTKDLIEGTALEDLIEMLVKLFENEKLARHPEARLQHKIWSKLKDEPGPLLLGLNDGRLTEPWRLFLDKWDIWLPTGEEEGVELFWEGEAEDDDGKEIEILQSLTFLRSELTLYAKLGPLEDKITFDGEAFYRLKTEL